MNEYMRKRMEQILAGRPIPEKKKHTIPKVSKKRAEKIAEQKTKGADSEMDLFFDEMIRRCTGRCLFCNSKTTVVDHNLWREQNERLSNEANQKKWDNDVKRIKRASVAHLMPKSKFHSIATHEDCWIELCWSCHTSFDSGAISWLTLKDSKEWEIIREKLLIVLPLVAEEERKHKLYSKLISLVYDGQNDLH